MKTLNLFWLPSGRLIAYGEDAKLCRLLMLGPNQEPQTPFVIEAPALSVLLTVAMRHGWLVVIANDSERSQQDAG